MVWADEFNYSGLPDIQKWNFEKGYVRDNEMQYYTSEKTENTPVENSNQVIEARNDSIRIDGKIS